MQDVRSSEHGAKARPLRDSRPYMHISAQKSNEPRQTGPVLPAPAGANCAGTNLAKRNPPEGLSRSKNDRPSPVARAQSPAL